MVRRIRIDEKDVLIVVDVQNDFCPQGNLAVPGGNEVVPAVNRLGALFRNIILTQDWHPPGHSSFASAHPARKPYETISLPYGQQILWPDHCVQETPGAAFHKDLWIPHAALILRKGHHHTVDSYSAFFENDHVTSTGMGGYLRERGFTRVFLAGLAFDFCVRFSAEDAKHQEFQAIVIEDASRGIDVEGSMAAARRSLDEHGIPCWKTNDIGD